LAKLELKPDGLQRLRITFNIDSDAELARRAGVDRSQVHRVLAGDSKPGNRLIAGMLDVFGIGWFPNCSLSSLTMTRRRHERRADEGQRSSIVRTSGRPVILHSCLGGGSGPGNHRTGEAAMSTLAKIVGTLLLVGFMLHYWWITALTVAVVFAYRWGPIWWRQHCEAVEPKERRLAELAGRADQQHRWVMSGDERGMFGNYRKPQTRK
jgi:hypothetical protein